MNGGWVRVVTDSICWPVGLVHRFTSLAHMRHSAHSQRSQISSANVRLCLVALSTRVDMHVLASHDGGEMAESDLWHERGV